MESGTPSRLAAPTSVRYSDLPADARAGYWTPERIAVFTEALFPTPPAPRRPGPPAPPREPAFARRLRLRG